MAASTLGLARSALEASPLADTTGPRWRHAKAKDTQLLSRSEQIAAQRPSYGYRRIAAVLNRKLRQEVSAPVNDKRVHRVMAVHLLLLARRYTGQPDVHKNASS